MAKQPYTSTGNIVFAVNPYQWFPELYSKETQQKFWSSADELPSHVYAVSAGAFKGLKNGTNQSILVSGESGAGKTETVKICLAHLATDKSNNRVVQRIIDSNPLLEAFGNAPTRRNDNSSRFGKYLQLQFSPENQELIGTIWKK